MATTVIMSWLCPWREGCYHHGAPTANGGDRKGGYTKKEMHLCMRGLSPAHTDPFRGDEGQGFVFCVDGRRQVVCCGVGNREG